jgi:hypothetical protein
MKLQVEIGTPYQYIDGLFESSEQQATDLLKLWADTGRFREVSCDEAMNLGFGELAEWSNPDTDALFLIDDVVLVAQNRQSLLEFNKKSED